MYFKLALRNVKKSYRDFLIYFLTLAFSVCLFYTFNSFQDQQYVMQMNEAQTALIETLSLMMGYLSVFVAIVLAFLILYANNFLIKRRKKELGLYMLLGMPKNSISKVLIYETFLIGLLSLALGMAAGFLLSQLLTIITAHLFEVTLNYTFVFSMKATIWTVLSFSIIFLIIMIFNTFVLNRYQLIDLLNASKKNEEMKIKKIWISIILFLISIICIGWAYYQGIEKGLLAANMIGWIILAGSVGTVLFFLSLAGFLFIVIQSNRNIYFKNLHCFITRQINASINTNFLSMSIVCIMLLLSIGALSTGLNMSSTMNKMIRFSTPYDISYTNHVAYFDYDTSELKEFDHSPLDIEQAIVDISLNPSYIKSTDIIHVYADDDLLISNYQLIDQIKEEDIKAFLASQLGCVEIVKLSDYNKAAAQRELAPLHLKENEAYLYSNYEMVDDGIEDILDAKPTLNVYQKPLKIANDRYERVSLHTTVDNGFGEYMILVVPDEIVPANASIFVTYWNTQLTDKITPQKFSSYFIERMNAAYDVPEIIDRFLQQHYLDDVESVMESNKGMSVLFTYIGIYLGIVFMIASAVILALQQLSQANDNKNRYQILSKIGADKRMINHTVFMEIAIYFLLPLLLAIVHSIIGIQVVNNVLIMFGKGDILLSSLFTAGIIILIYGSYFMVTYLGYKNILKS